LAISFFFWSPAAFETFSKLLAHRSHMSACMNDKAFLSWSFFWPPNFWLLSFSFDLKPHLKRWDHCRTMGPACHPLCTIKFLFLDYFWLLIFGHLPFSFDLMPRLKRWGTCWLMGPACHPLCTTKVYFLGVFFSLSDFWLFPFSFDPLPPWKRWVSC
jgi:hypothetical protein